jgi:hypothetical protein
VKVGRSISCTATMDFLSLSGRLPVIGNERQREAT